MSVTDDSRAPGTALRTPTMVLDVSAAQARTALAEVVPQLAALVRTIGNPQAPSVGTWTAADVAVHLAHAWEILPTLAAGAAASPLSNPADLAALTTAMVGDDQRHDVAVAAERIEAAAARYLASPVHADAAQPWLFAGTAMPPAVFACHLLSESLVHGYDIAHAERRPWRIERAHAAMAILGFAVPALSVIDPRFPVAERYRSARACFDLRVRGSGRVFLVFDNGELHMERPSARRVDCHVSGDPVALLLVVWSRAGHRGPTLRGRITAWGRRPWLADRLPRMLRTP